jgi:hypothetical protein
VTVKIAPGTGGSARWKLWDGATLLADETKSGHLHLAKQRRPPPAQVGDLSLARRSRRHPDQLHPAVRDEGL